MKPHPRGPRTAAHTLVLAAAATLLIASCGSDEQSDSTSAAQAGPSSRPDRNVSAGSDVGVCGPSR